MRPMGLLFAGDLQLFAKVKAEIIHIQCSGAVPVSKENFVMNGRLLLRHALSTTSYPHD